MIALRLAGCAFVLLAAALWCARYAASLDAKIEAYERAVRFISFVRSEIGFYETPFPQIVRKFASAEGIAAPGEIDADVDSTGASICELPDADDSARFASFFSSIGGGFSETEIASCDGAAAYFKERAAELRADAARKKRVQRALTVFVAATVCLLVL